MKKENVLWLDSLRGIACIMVLVAHIISIHPIIGKYVSGCGKIGVWCFMVLSAYLLYFTRDDGNRQFGLHDLKIFYIKRFLRMIPTYIVVLIFSYLIGYFVIPKEIIYHIIGLHGVGHFWYMPVIMKFYLIMPLFLYLKVKIKKIYNFMILVILLIISLIYSPYTNYVENSIQLRWYLPVFLMGMLLAIIVEEMKKKKYLDSVYFDCFAIVCVLIGVGLIPYMRELLFGFEPSNWLQNKYLLFGILWSILVLSITLGKYIKKVFTKTILLQFIGKISYELYLFHFVILIMLMSRVQNTWINGFITIVCSTVLSIIVYYLLDKPIQKIKRNLK